jgi:D-arabinose 1-dehydrogenase-like Zn-dependent alcohol dehydrogenase
MSRRVQFDHYGSADVLRVVDVPRPSADDGQVLVRVAAAGINPGEIAIRNGAMEQMFPTTFPSGQGSDFAGRVVEVGSGVTEFAPGDEVMGWSDSRSAQADHVVSDRQHLTAKPRALDWAKAGIMIKESTRPGSAYAAIMITPGHGVRMQDNYTQDTAGLPGAVSTASPRWLRLTRSGDTITGYDSDDGTHWTQVGTVHLAGLSSTIQASLFAASRHICG